MADREKVINGLTDIYDEAYDRWVHCQYTQDKLLMLIEKTMPDALALLREQSSDKDINVHGKWIRLTGMAPPEYHGHKICSVCECFAPYDPLHPGREMLSPYCPGCGTKMEVQEET